MKKIDLNLNKIMQLHKDGLSERQIANIFNVSRSTIYNRINNIHYNIGDRKCFTVNEKFFDKVTDLNCYWAGFIAADGNISNNSLRIEIHKKDKTHLEKLKICSNFNGVIHSRAARNMVSLGITSNNIVNKLNVNFNIIPCKSKILIPPKLIKEEHVRNFIRGYIDGDGSYLNKYNLLSIRGTKNILLWIKDCFNQYANLNTKASVCYDGWYRLQIRGVRFYTKIVKWLFKNSSNMTTLDRKYNLVKHIVGKINHCDFNQVETKDYKQIEQKIIIDRQNGMLKTDIAKEHKVSTSHVTNILKKYNINHYDKKRLTYDEIKQIRELINKDISYITIADMFGVGRSAIYEISNNITWKKFK